MKDRENFQKVVFERVQFGLRQACGAVEVEQGFPPEVFADQIVAEFTAYFMKNVVVKEVSREKVKEEVETEQTLTEDIRFADGWWNAFKEQFAPRWFLSRFPVYYRTVALNVTNITKKYITEKVTVHEHTNLCPHLAAGARQQDHVTFMMQERPPTASQYRHGDEW